MKPYTCPTCGKAFAKESSVMKHAVQAHRSEEGPQRVVVLRLPPGLLNWIDEVAVGKGLYISRSEFIRYAANHVRHDHGR